MAGIACCLALLLPSCAGQKPVTVEQGSSIQAARTPEEVRWGHQSKAVNLNIKASPDLNSENNQAHTVLVCVYQLSKTDSFNALAGNAEGLSTLLRCKNFDDSVMTAEQFIVSPGQVTGLVYDRAEGARHLALVAGYAELNPQKATRLRSFPIAKKSEGSLFWKEDYYYPGKLEMAVLLGSQGIQQLEGEQ